MVLLSQVSQVKLQGFCRMLGMVLVFADWTDDTRFVAFGVETNVVEFLAMIFAIMVRNFEEAFIIRYRIFFHIILWNLL